MGVDVELINNSPEKGAYCETCGSKHELRPLGRYCKDTGKEKGEPYCPKDPCHTRHDVEYISVASWAPLYRCRVCDKYGYATAGGNFIVADEVVRKELGLANA